MPFSPEDKENSVPARQVTPPPPPPEDITTDEEVDDDVGGGDIQEAADSYAAISSLDAEESESDRWRERAAVVTRIDHDCYAEYARGILRELADAAVRER